MKPTTIYKTLTLAAALFALDLGAPRADIVTYYNGKVLKGIVEESAQDPDNISFTGDMGKIRIPRSRIKDIQRESKAQGFINLGQSSVAKQDFTTALRFFQQALDLEPANPKAKQLIDEIQGRIVEQQRLSRADAVSQIDKLAAQARDLARQGQFKKAEEQLKEADKLVPNPEQAQKLATVISDLYLAWAEEREDKLDKGGAEQKLNLALAANPNNEKVIEKMLLLWEDNPQKREQVTKVYETILERHPQNRDLRKKLGDLYYEMGRSEDSEHHYMILYKDNDQYKGTELESRLVELLDKLHLQYARQKDFDKAIYYYKVLSTISSEVDPTAIIFYQYAKRANQVRPDDLKGRLDLAQFAEQNGLDQEALKTYRDLLAFDGAKEPAQAGIQRYAQKALATAQFQLQSGNYTLAMSLAEQVRTDYPNVESIQEKLSELIARARAEQEKDRRQRRELAKDVLQRADEFYQTGWTHFNNIFNVERRNMPGLVSDRAMAKQYFNYAVDAYQEALRIDPSLGTESESLINVRLNECRNMLARLNQRPPALPENYGRQTYTAPVPVVVPVVPVVPVK